MIREEVCFYGLVRWQMFQEPVVLGVIPGVPTSGCLIRGPIRGWSNYREDLNEGGGTIRLSN